MRSPWYMLHAVGWMAGEAQAAMWRDGRSDGGGSARTAQHATGGCVAVQAAGCQRRAVTMCAARAARERVSRSSPVRRLWVEIRTVTPPRRLHLLVAGRVHVLVVDGEQERILRLQREGDGPDLRHGAGRAACGRHCRERGRKDERAGGQEECAASCDCSSCHFDVLGWKLRARTSGPSGGHAPTRCVTAHDPAAHTHRKRSRWSR